jgi:diadenosine tetraphosphate (Ap4A) HIT family hydrolase
VKNPVGALRKEFILGPLIKCIFCKLPRARTTATTHRSPVGIISIILNRFPKHGHDGGLYRHTKDLGRLTSAERRNVAARLTIRPWRRPYPQGHNLGINLERLAAGIRDHLHLHASRAGWVTPTDACAR